jgi:hypothetical protein
MNTGWLCLRACTCEKHPMTMKDPARRVPMRRPCTVGPYARCPFPGLARVEQAGQERPAGRYTSCCSPCAVRPQDRLFRAIHADRSGVPLHDPRHVRAERVDGAKGSDKLTTIRAAASRGRRRTPIRWKARRRVHTKSDGTAESMVPRRAGAVCAQDVREIHPAPDGRQAEKRLSLSVRRVQVGSVRSQKIDDVLEA